MKGRKTGGRRKGVPNKLTRTVKQAFEAAFADSQADPLCPSNLEAFKKANPKEFIAVCARLIPNEIKGQMEHKHTAPALEVVAAALGLPKK